VSQTSATAPHHGFQLLRAVEVLPIGLKHVPRLADRAGAVWIAAERRMRAELEKEGLAKGTLRRGSIIEPRENNSTLAEIGLFGSAGKHRAARAKTLLSIPERATEMWSAP
jgi:hypothetical protein